MDIFKINDNFYVHSSFIRNQPGFLVKIAQDFSYHDVIENSILKPVQHVTDDVNHAVILNTADTITGSVCLLTKSEFEGNLSINGNYLNYSGQPVYLEQIGDRYILKGNSDSLYAETSDLLNYSPAYPVTTDLSTHTNPSFVLSRNNDIIRIDKEISDPTHNAGVSVFDETTSKWVPEFYTDLFSMVDLGTVKFANNRYIYIWNGYFCTSIDGITSDTSYQMAAYNIVDFGFINGQYFYIYDTDETVQFYTSNDAITWAAAQTITPGDVVNSKLWYTGTYYYIRLNDAIYRTPNLNTTPWVQIMADIGWSNGPASFAANSNVIAFLDTTGEGGFLLRYTVDDFESITDYGVLDYAVRVVADETNVLISYGDYTTNLNLNMLLTDSTTWDTLTFPAAINDFIGSAYARDPILRGNKIVYTQTSSNEYFEDSSMYVRNLNIISTTLGSTWVGWDLFDTTTKFNSNSLKTSHTNDIAVVEDIVYRPSRFMGNLSIDKLHYVNGSFEVTNVFYDEITQTETSVSIIEKNWLTDLHRFIINDGTDTFLLAPYQKVGDSTTSIRIYKMVNGIFNELVSTPAILQNTDPKLTWGMTYDGINYIIYNSLYVYMSTDLENFSINILQKDSENPNQWLPTPYTGGQNMQPIPDLAYPLETDSIYLGGHEIYQATSQSIYSIVADPVSRKIMVKALKNRDLKNA